MAKLKVFVSSTCYDLSIVRSQVRSYIKQLGHDPVMSDYMEVLYDPREHTHKSCIQEISGCDIAILIIGSRFGGKGVPAAFDEIDFAGLEEKSASPAILQSKEKLSVTQLEICKAIEDGIPVFTFVDDKNQGVRFADRRINHSDPLIFLNSGLRFASLHILTHCFSPLKEIDGTLTLICNPFKAEQSECPMKLVSRLKVELIYAKNYSSIEEAKSSIFAYIEIFYNRKRRHSANDNMSPVAFEEKAALAA